MMRDLVLPVKKIYFDQIKAGDKTQENRLVNPYWSKRLIGRAYGRVVITLGYPKKGDPDRTLAFPWAGYEQRTITHPHFGVDPVEVFSINLISTSHQHD